MSALPSFEWSWTVSYGPTCFCEVTVTVAPSAPPKAAGTPAEENEALLLAPQPAPPPPPHVGGGGQLAGGDVTSVAVSVLIVWNRMSALSPTVTVPLMGRTHANDDGDPL